VERTVSRLSGCRRLHRRYERKPEHFLAFTDLRVTLARRSGAERTVQDEAEFTGIDVDVLPAAKGSAPPAPSW
jgi:hypothetical protein